MGKSSGESGLQALRRALLTGQLLVIPNRASLVYPVVQADRVFFDS
jgi:hypothetical protein